MILNLGCGTKTSPDPEVKNLDWSALLRLRKSRLLHPVCNLIVTGERRVRFHELPDNIVVTNIAKGLPFPSGSVDAVYHSHVLEHLDPPDALALFSEVRRVLRSGGIHRVAVPDFEYLCRAYLDDVGLCDRDPTAVRGHDGSIAAIIDQMVRKIPAGTERQNKMRRIFELLVLGDARRRGETHQWMYDRHNLADLFQSCGFVRIQRCQFNDSAIERWRSLGLEVDEVGAEYKADSLYMEGCRPA